MKIKVLVNVLTLFALLVSLLGNVTPAYAATLIVTNTNDSGPGSLRQTILDAAPGDTITFDAGLSGGIIRLASTLTLDKNVTIDGSSLASKITISGDTTGDGTGDVQVFYINGNMVTLDSLIITKGISTYGGGGIYIWEGITVIIKNSTISDSAAPNFGGGISSFASSLTIENSTISNNSSTFYANSFAGGIYNGGALLTIKNSTITNNFAPESGGIANNGTMTITNSTITGNYATGTGGGGGVSNSGTLTIANSTISGNSGGPVAGGVANGSILTITNSTISGNSATTGGGVASGGTLNYSNTIIANSTSGGDCFLIGTLGTNTNNLVEDGSCSAALSGDPKLDVLADNGGLTQTFGLLAGSPAIDAGDDSVCLAAPVNSLDQRGVTRLIGAHCDIGSFESDLPLTVISILRASSNPTSAATVSFTVTFSEPVTGVDTTDFSMNMTGSVSGAAVSSVTGADAVYTVTASTGSGSGALGLDVSADSDIAGLTGHPLTGLPFSAGEIYTINKTLTFNSIAAQDGWVLESAENSNKGGTMNNAATTFNLGDDAAKRQYRSVLSFDTSSLPDTAVITKATLKVKKQAIIGGGNPFTIFHGLLADIKAGTFGLTPLQTGDFQVKALNSFGPFTPGLTGGWYSMNLTAGKANINKLITGGGLTQIRLRFQLDDNNNAVANYLSLFSGNAPLASRPQLIVEYYIP